MDLHTHTHKHTHCHNTDKIINSNSQPNTNHNIDNTEEAEKPPTPTTKPSTPTIKSPTQFKSVNEEYACTEIAPTPLKRMISEITLVKISKAPYNHDKWG